MKTKLTILAIGCLCGHRTFPPKQARASAGVIAVAVAVVAGVPGQHF